MLQDHDSYAGYDHRVEVLEAVCEWMASACEHAFARHAADIFGHIAREAAVAAMTAANAAMEDCAADLRKLFDEQQLTDEECAHLALFKARIELAGEAND